MAPDLGLVRSAEPLLDVKEAAATADDGGAT
jgi:hypothetical protein